MDADPDGAGPQKAGNGRTTYYFYDIRTRTLEEASALSEPLPLAPVALQSPLTLGLASSLSTNTGDLGLGLSPNIGSLDFGALPQATLLGGPSLADGLSVQSESAFNSPNRWLIGRGGIVEVNPNFLGLNGEGNIVLPYAYLGNNADAISDALRAKQGTVRALTNGAAWGLRQNNWYGDIAFGAAVTLGGVIDTVVPGTGTEVAATAFGTKITNQLASKFVPPVKNYLIAKFPRLGTDVGKKLNQGVSWLGEQWQAVKGRFVPKASSAVGASVGLDSAQAYLSAVAQFKGVPQSKIRDFYAVEEAIGVNYKELIGNAVQKHSLTPDETHAIYGYTTKLFYRDLNKALESGGGADAKALSALIRSGLSTMPPSSTTQFRGWRLEADKLAAFDKQFSRGSVVKSEGFWSSAPNEGDAYLREAARSAVIVVRPGVARDISDLSFGVNYHGIIGKPYFSSESILPPGLSFRVVETDALGRLILRQK